MATLGVVSYANVGSLGKLQILQQTSSNTLSAHPSEKQELLAVRRKQLPPALKMPESRGRKRPTPQQQPLPVAVARRNARERNRVKQVNNGFATLRQHIPVSIAAAYASSEGSRGVNKKLSKVETLRMAVDYIRSLQQLLAVSDMEGRTFPAVDSASSHRTPRSGERFCFDEDRPDLPSPNILIDDDDDDDASSILDATSPDPSKTLPHYQRLCDTNSFIQLVDANPQVHKTFGSETPLYEVDENVDPVILSQDKDLHPELLQSDSHTLVSVYTQPELLQPPTTADSPVIYRESSLSPGTNSEKVADGDRPSAFLPTFSATCSGFGYPGYHLAFKRETQLEVGSEVSLDIMSWWEQEQKLRQQTTSS